MGQPAARVVEQTLCFLKEHVTALDRFSPPIRTVFPVTCLEPHVVGQLTLEPAANPTHT
jgi:hypothetical protein